MYTAGSRFVPGHAEDSRQQLLRTLESEEDALEEGRQLASAGNASYVQGVMGCPVMAGLHSWHLLMGNVIDIMHLTPNVCESLSG